MGGNFGKSFGPQNNRYVKLKLIISLKQNSVFMFERNCSNKHSENINECRSSSVEVKRKMSFDKTFKTDTSKNVIFFANCKNS